MDFELEKYENEQKQLHQIDKQLSPSIPSNIISWQNFESVHFECDVQQKLKDASFKDNFTAIKKRYNSAQAEFEAGILSKTDVAFAKTRMSAAKIALINSDINYEKAKNIFRDITGVEAKDLKFQSIKSKEIFEKEQFIENVKSGSFAIRLATLDVKSKNALTGIARSSLLPKISLNASQTEYYDYSSTVDQFDNETINATITWQIFNSGSSLSKIRQAEKFKNSSYINQLIVIRDTLNRANFSHSQYVISSETVDAAKIALESAEFAYNGTVIEQEVGERTLLDVLDARQQLLNSEIDLFKEQRNEQIIEAFIVSIKIASFSATISTILGVMIGYSLVRIKKIPFKSFYIFLSSTPLVLPELILGLAMLLFFISLNNLISFPSTRGQLTIFISHVTFCIAFVAIIIQARLTDFNKNIEEAAMDLGYNYTMVIYKVTLPIIFPSIIAGWLLAFTISLDDLVVASFTTGPGANTLPIVVFSKVRLGLSPEVNALSSILMLVLVLIGVVYFFLNNKLNVKK